ncbi:MAG: D-galactarolactone cycloisomerase [Alphaproteobacteria bacterium MarineAlpha5_Bin5]|nr:MAG: D-galactarolactone cycloisomerase [Alphaproteobacteria bacterium MarineAlpha5_Bin5]
MVKISKIETYSLLIPDFDSDACSSAQDNFVVKIYADNGLYGIGESDTNPWGVKAIIDSPGTHAMGRGFADILIGKDPRNVEGLWHELNEKTMMTSRRGLGICAIGAIDMALWDLCGKIYQQPVWKLLGGSKKNFIIPYASLLPEGHTLNEYSESLVNKTIKSKKLGFKAAKLEICIKGPYSHNNLHIEDDTEFAKMVTLCRKAVGNDMVLMADVAYAWSDWKSALKALNMIKEENLYFIETPLPIEDLEGSAKLASRTDIRIATGEMLQTRFECFETIEKGRVDVIQPDVGRVGGLTEAKRVCDYAEDRGILVVPHCWKSAIGIAASTHLSATTLSCPYIEFLPKELAESQLRKDLVLEELPVIDGKIHLPEKPGLGIELNEEKLKQYNV